VPHSFHVRFQIRGRYSPLLKGEKDDFQPSSNDISAISS
jgi:hypothetical protein